MKTAERLRRDRLRELGAEFSSVSTDSWESFAFAFGYDNHIVGENILLELKEITVC
jgi:hypothetical protein